MKKRALYILLAFSLITMAGCKKGSGEEINPSIYVHCHIAGSNVSSYSIWAGDGNTNIERHFAPVANFVLDTYVPVSAGNTLAVMAQTDNGGCGNKGLSRKMYISFTGYDGSGSSVDYTANAACLPNNHASVSAAIE